jgi:hypothetical protein
MSNQANELKRRLKQAVNSVAERKGLQWAKETQAEFQASERFLSSISEGDAMSGDPVRSGAWYIDPNLAMEMDSESSFMARRRHRITPHDTGNLIEAISVSHNKQGNSHLFSVGVDYTKLNRHRYLYSWYYKRHEHPGVFVERPGKNISGEYVREANENSDERRDFLKTWDERGLANVKRIFR